MNESEILGLFQRRNAVWLFDHKGNPQAPHAELASGLCSDGYFNSAPVLCDPYAVEMLARQLMFMLRERKIGKVDWVVGSPYAAITLSYQLARFLDALHGFAEKDPKDQKKMLWKRFVIPPDAVVLQCEELITTLGTAMEVRRAVEEENPRPVRFLPEVATIIHRPEKLGNTGAINVVTLVAREVKSWKPEDCPLCKQGSPRMRPKQNWAKLTGQAAV